MSVNTRFETKSEVEESQIVGNVMDRADGTQYSKYLKISPSQLTEFEGFRWSLVAVEVSKGKFRIVMNKYDARNRQHLDQVSAVALLLQEGVDQRDAERLSEKFGDFIMQAHKAGFGKSAHPDFSWENEGC